MEQTKNRLFLLVPLCFAVLTLSCWIRSPKSESLAERRKLAQMPAFSVKALESGRFSSDFERYSQDQFPLRETFRTAKALFSTKVLGRKDNNSIYCSNGYYAQLEYPENPASADYAAEKFTQVYNRYLTEGNRVYLSVIPDKGNYLEGNPKMDYDAFVARLRQGTPFAAYIDLFPTLSLDCYYRTDTHWRQEMLKPAAEALSHGMGKTLRETYSVQPATRDFLGVYAGQAALPMEKETLSYVTSPAIEGAQVVNRENGKGIGVYDFEALAGRDPYEFYLSGSLSLITMTNPNAETEDRLILFRDSFGSSIAPYFLECYKEVTLVDIRYLPVSRLGKVLDFENADVLFLYSTLVLNNSETIK